jgi:hypothetical protein
MIERFAENDIFLVFSDAPGPAEHATRVLGPYQLVRFSAKGLSAWRRDQPGQTRVATRNVEDTGWEIDGFKDEPLWGTVEVVSPGRPTTSTEIEEGTDWIRPGK